jgi:hypothetical protein
MYIKANCLSAETRRTLSMALIRCHFDYSGSSWYAGISQGLKNKLQVKQNKYFIKLYGMAAINIITKLALFSDRTSSI